MIILWINHQKLRMNVLSRAKQRLSGQAVEQFFMLVSHLLLEAFFFADDLAYARLGSGQNIHANSPFSGFEHGGCNPIIGEKKGGNQSNFGGTFQSCYERIAEPQLWARSPDPTLGFLFGLVH